MRKHPGFCTYGFFAHAPAMVAVAWLLFFCGSARAQIFVTNSTNGTIGEYSLSGSTINAALVTGLNDPTGIAISQGDIYVLNSGSGTIGEYTLSGSAVNTSLVSSLTSPEYMTISAGDIFVAMLQSGTSNWKLGEYSLSGSALNTSLATITGVAAGLTTSGTNLLTASLIAFFPDPVEVGEYTTSGSAVNSDLFTVGNNVSVSGLASTGTDIYVTASASSSGTIMEYTTSGSLVSGSLVSGLTDAKGLALYQTDLFQVAATGTGAGEGEILEYTLSGSQVAGFSITGLNSPDGIAVIPEPGTCTIILLGLGVMFLWHRALGKKKSRT